MNPSSERWLTGKTTSQQIKSKFLFSFRIISGSLERQAKSLYLSANRFSVQRENSVKERNCPLKRPSISGLFPIFKKSARVGVIQLTLSMDIIQYLAYKKATKSEATQKSLTPKITATNSMCIFANLSTIGFRLSYKDWSLIAIL